VRGVLTPGSLDELAEVSRTRRVVLMGGGTVALPRWSDDGTDALLVRLSGIPLLRDPGRVGEGAGGCPAMTTLAEIAGGGMPDCLVRSAASVGGPALREAATVGGNIGNGSPACLAVALLALRAEVVSWTPGRGPTAGPLTALATTPPPPAGTVGRVVVSLGWSTPVRSVFVKVPAHGSFGPPALSLALARYGDGEVVLAAGGLGVPPRVLPRLSGRLRHEEAPVPVERLRLLVRCEGRSEAAGLDPDLVAGTLWRALEEERHDT
jgi:CO/xanthine dehydrogenase FAD-binding subunit